MGARPELKEPHGEQDPEKSCLTQSCFKSGPGIHGQGAGVCWGKEALSLGKTNGQHLLWILSPTHLAVTLSHSGHLGFTRNREL